MRRLLALVPYWYLLLIPTFLILAGSAINLIVMGLNYAQMPVLPFGGQCSPEVVFWITKEGRDVSHVCMNASSHLKIFSDWMNLMDAGIGVASPADLLVFLGQDLLYPAWFAWIVLMIHDRRERSKIQ